MEVVSGVFSFRGSKTTGFAKEVPLLEGQGIVGCTPTNVLLWEIPI